MQWLGVDDDDYEDDEDEDVSLDTCKNILQCLATHQCAAGRCCRLLQPERLRYEVK